MDIAKGQEVERESECAARIGKFLAKGERFQMSFKRWMILHCCFLLLSSACQTNPANSQQSASTQGTASQQAVANSNSVAAQNTTVGNSNAPAGARTVDACSLLTSSEIESVQGEEVRETKSGAANSGRFASLQCLYVTATYANSVSLKVTRRASAQANAPSPKEFWKERFEREDREKEGEGRDEREEKSKGEAGKPGGAREEEEEGNPAKPVTGVGDEAFWVGNRIAGALYVLKGDSIIRLSLGGSDEESARMEKTVALARMVVNRLKD